MSAPRPYVGLLAGLLLAALIVMPLLLTGQLWLLFAGAAVGLVTWWGLGADEEGAR